MWTWRGLTIWAVSFCSEAGDVRLAYFYDYFAREYREGRKDKLFPDSAAMSQGIKPEDVKNCRDVLRNSFAGYREGRNAGELKRLLGEYREYVSGCHGGSAKDRYNAFVYRYMVEGHAGSKAIGARLGVTKETAGNYIRRSMDEILALCMGLPAAMGNPGDRESAVGMLVSCSRLLGSMAGDYISCLFPGRREWKAVQQGRRLTRNIMGQLEDAVGAYLGYCNDVQTHIDTDIRKAAVLEECLAGVPAAAIARKYGCSEGTVYADIRENGRRLAAMLFGVGGSAACGEKDKPLLAHIGGSSTL